MDSKRKADEPAAGGGSPAKILKEGELQMAWF